MNCRFCNQNLTNEFVDLGFSPPSNSFLNKEDLNKPEVFYPLRIMVCEKCFLVQIDEFAKHDDIFNGDYVYFSSFSTSWLKHAEKYTEMMVNRFGFNENSKVVEIASNDGYLLQYFLKKGIPVLGIEPTSNTASVAIEKGVETVVDFFGKKLASELSSKNIKADLILGNNVLAHVPDINDFVGGLPILLKDSGVITFEFPHLLKLIKENQFDTIYHEHFSYLSLYSVQKIFKSNGLEIFDVEEVSTHGGSLRIFAQKEIQKTQEISINVQTVLNQEKDFGLQSLEIYQGFQVKSEKVKNDFWSFLLEAKKNGKKVAAYGAAAKGVTLLNFCGIRKDLINFVVDASPYKRDKFLPGIHIPVVSESWIKEVKPDYVVILPWNLKNEIQEQLHYIREWGACFVTAVPEINIF
ncbi:class I SAM-dependent methyltransferase [Sediminibacterium sp.]|uniref:class I SAM-dependent methyltransferase n=1 Tax=Sediminibacterium sp. TaxID=1917865 RepID=UPI0025FEBCE8|nr:class I SAM-dependent methyltransferase [Sediminibacterium sp.]